MKYIEVENNIESMEKELQTGKYSAALFESPSNPKLNIYDIQELAKLCKQHKCMLVIDGSFCSSIFQNPLDLGADIAMHAGTKYIGGHSDIIIGFLCMNDEEIYNKLRVLRDNMGTTVTEDVCFRALLSL